MTRRLMGHDERRMGGREGGGLRTITDREGVQQVRQIPTEPIAATDKSPLHPGELETERALAIEKAT